MKLLICILLCVVCAFAQQTGPGGSPCKQRYFENPNGGLWTDVDNWNWDADDLGRYQPRTIDDVHIELDFQVDVNLPLSRLVRTLDVARGNRLIINDGVLLVLQADSLPCYPGNFVDPVDSFCKSCINLQYQVLSDQSFCDNCGDYEMIPNPTRESCYCCPVGHIWAGAVNATSREAACDACPDYQSSSGDCGKCFCCPAGTSSFSGFACFDCPTPYNSHECGACVLCLPSLRDKYCHCNNNGVCEHNLKDAFGVVRDVCSCTGGCSGPKCNINPYDESWAQFAILSNYPVSQTLPYPFQVVYENKLRAMPTGPTLIFNSDTIAIDASAAVKSLSLDTDWEACGYVNPITNGPAGYEATIFGWDLQVWDPQNNAPIQDNITQPWYIRIPYDNLNVVNPFALHTFYYNTDPNEMKWIDVTYTCTEAARPTTIQNQQGTITGPAYQLSAQYHVFIKLSDDTFGTNVGTGDGSSVQQGDVFSGNSRPTTPTTGVTGVLPVPIPNPIPDAPVSAPVHNVDIFHENNNAAHSFLPPIFVALFVIFFLF